jgi:predicted NBD/HSP70 family sugar kinase
MNPSLAIGIDLGGIKIAGALASRRGRVPATNRRPTEAGRGPDVVLDNLAGSIAELLAQAGGQVVSSRWQSEELRGLRWNSDLLQN